MPKTFYISETQKQCFEDLIETYEAGGNGAEEARVEFLDRAISELDAPLIQAQDLLDYFEDMVEVIDSDALVIIPSHEEDLARIPICLPEDLYDKTVETFLDVSGHKTLKEFYFDSQEMSKTQKETVKSRLEPEYSDVFEDTFLLERVITQFPCGIQSATFTGRESLEEIRDSFMRSFSPDILSVEKSLTSAISNTLQAISSMSSKNKIGFYVVLAETLHKLANAHMKKKKEEEE